MRRRRAAVLTVALLALVGCAGQEAPRAEPDTQASSTRPPVDAGRLMFSEFDEITHTYHSTLTSFADGTDMLELDLPGPEGGGRWSGDGNHIAVMTILDDTRVGTAILAPDGSVERTLNIPDSTLNLVCTVWSPDDSRLACEGWDETDASRTGIYAVSSSDGGGLHRLTKPPADLADLPGDWTPDGSRLIFKRAVGESPGKLYVVPREGGDLEQFSSLAVEDPGRYSADGALVLTSADGALLFLGTDGQITSQLEQQGQYLFGPVWSPDDLHIAYSKAPRGPSADVYTSLPDGKDEQQVTHTPENEIRVEWGAP